MSRTSNELAFDIVQTLLDATVEATSLEIAGKQVAIDLGRDAARPWPDPGFTGVAPQPSLPAPIKAECSWEGGKTTLLVEVVRDSVPKRAGDVCLSGSANTSPSAKPGRVVSSFNSSRRSLNSRFAPSISPAARLARA